MTDAEMIAIIVKCPSPHDVPIAWRPTEFEQLLEQLHLNETTCLGSAAVLNWYRTNRHKRFVPEAVLRHFKLEVTHDDFGAESPLLLNTHS